MNHAAAGRQSGVALIVVLLLLLVVTVLGLAAMRGTVMQERMSGNANARAKAFQFAEAVLREAEVVAASRPPIPASGCVDGVCAMVAPTATPPWESPTFWTTAGAGYRVSGQELQDTEFNLVARYVIEDMGEGNAPSAGCTSDIDMSAPGCGGGSSNAQNYRITAYARLGDGAEVVLQSGYQVP
ncbi:pilus assembly PilX family protein [Arenimonas fontis]|uniref:Pilus assembly protein n=1 Tax=Arenimonas fontis TaxID=2608255 RepID=A0A5B2Z8S5_9GAMM|nr:PilX N-terminal domain-containing pilus assembly protein [Arenimonas fontis]KAA2283913.1 pilus assembly protein [Arenimonas fontis]